MTYGPRQIGGSIYTRQQHPYAAEVRIWSGRENVHFFTRRFFLFETDLMADFSEQKLRCNSAVSVFDVNGIG